MESGFFNSVDGDRRYNARDISRYFEHIISSGLYKAINGCMKVSAAGGMSLNVAPGAGLIDCQWFRLESSTTVSIGAANAALPRIDSVVVRLDSSDAVRAIDLAVVQGVPSASPVATAPARTETVKELVIAHVYVGAAASAITSANITDTRANADICGWAQSQVDAPLLTAVSTVYTATANNTNIINIDVSAYDATTDIINVYVDGLRLSPGVDYVVDRDAHTITLAKPIAKDSKVGIEALKPIIPDDLPSAAETMARVLAEVSAYNARISENEAAIDSFIDGIPVVSAISEDGKAYRATVPNVGELYNGLIITIIPNMTSTTTTITLDVNELGPINVRLPLSTNNAIMVQPVNDGYYVEGRPLTLQYDAAYLSGRGTWKVHGKQRVSAQDLYGVTPIANGGTGAETPEAARAALGVTPANIGAVPVTDANSSAFDMNTIIKSGLHYGFYKTGSQTLNTPYKSGLTGLAVSLIMSFGSDANYATQIAYISGSDKVCVRQNRNGAISDWRFANDDTITPVANGGTGADNPAAALANLGVVYVDSEDSLPAPGNAGRIYIVPV